MPLFSQCEDSLDTSLSSSQISYIPSNIMNTQQVGEGNSVLIEDSDTENGVASPPPPPPPAKKVQKAPAVVPEPVRQLAPPTQQLPQFQLNQQQQLRQFKPNQQPI